MAPGTDVQAVQIQDSTLAINDLSEKQALINITAVPSTPETPAPTTADANTLVLDPSLVTQDFDLLRFHAAAFTQLSGLKHDSTTQDPTTTYSNLLISSPYNTPLHHLDLTTLPLPSLLFAKALTALQPTTPTYATAPYTSALNFDHVLQILRTLIPTDFAFPETSFYVVVFRSQLKPDIDQDRLYLLDYESHREACESGGLLKYWFGKADGERRNLATCFWHSREDAYKGGLGPWHKKARAAGREMYEKIVFGTWRFVVEEGARGWRCVEWDGE